jgi:hypothetical protein
MSNKKVRDKKVEIIKFTNEMFDCFNPKSPRVIPLLKLDNLLTLNRSYRLGIFREKVEGCPEYKSFVKKANGLIEDFRKQKKEEFDKELESYKTSLKEVKVSEEEKKGMIANKTKQLDTQLKNLTITKEDIPEFESLINDNEDIKFTIEKMNIPWEDISKPENKRDKLGSEEFRLLMQFFNFTGVPE